MNVYQQAWDSYRYEGLLVWIRFSGMLVADSILATVLAAVAFDSSTDLSSATRFSLSFSLAIAGILLGIGWLVLTQRGFNNMDRLLPLVRGIEDKHLSDLSEIHLHLKLLRRNPGIRPHQIQYLVATLFVVLFAAFLIVIVIKQCM